MLDHQQGRRRAASSNHPAEDKQSKPRDEAKRRADYARQIARSEFGRFYWNDEQARRLQEAMARRRRE
jgi:hypothetical protein